LAIPIIAIADTGDSVLDSGLFVGNVAGSNFNVSGSFVEVNGTNGADTIAANLAPELTTLGGGQDTVTGTAAEFDGDLIDGFGDDDALAFEGSEFGTDNVVITQGSAILDIDSDQDGTADTKLTLQGDFSAATFAFDVVDGNTIVTAQGVVQETNEDQVLVGTAGDDMLTGSNGNDTISGIDGNDLVTGGGGNDLLAGGAGNDVVNGGTGDDNMGGGAGNDTFIFTELTDGERDVITDWTNGEDLFRLTGITNAPGSGLQGRVDALDITAVAGGVEFGFDGHTVFLQGASVGDLGLEDFIFV